MPTFAGKPVELVDACAGVLAWTWQTVIPVQITVLSDPSRFTVTAVTIDVISASAVDTGATATLVDLGVTVGRFEALWTLAVKPILLIHTRAPISAGARGTLIYLHITFGTGKSRLANTVVAIDAIFANSIITRITGTVVKVYLTVCA